MIRGVRVRGVLSCTALVVAVAVNVVGVIQVGEARATAGLGTSRFVDAAAHPSGRGLYLLDRDGGVQTRGEAVYRGSLPERGVTAEAAELVPTSSGRGYWLFDTAGGVHAFGDAPYLGSPAQARGPGAPVIAAAATPSGRGYLVLDAEGGIFTFGDAAYLGSIPGLREAGVPVGPAPAVDIATDPGGRGYLVLDAEGGIFTFGDAAFLGSIPALRAAGTPLGVAAVRDIVASRSGGYWITDAVGGIFTFGPVQFHGSAPGRGHAFPLVATAVMPDGSGYWMVDGTGALLGFGAAFGGAGDGFRLMETQRDGSPVRLNPCRQIPFVVHLGPGSPGNAHTVAVQAMAVVGEATGVHFVDRGTTGEAFSLRSSRPWWDHPSYGAGPAPVLISFEPPNGTNGLGSGDAGLSTRQSATNAAGRMVTVTGSVVVNTAFGLGPDFSDAGSYGAVLLHELGHVIGLDHVEDGRQIMSGVLTRGNPGTYQDGDRRGLAALGSAAGCVEDPRPS